MRAIFEGDVDRFDELVAQGFDVLKVIQPENWNLLHRALVSVTLVADAEMIIHLLDLGIPVNDRDQYGYTPLHYAARCGNSQVIKVLLDYGAEVDPIGQDGMTPLRLLLTSHSRKIESIELLLTRGADLDQRIDDGASVYEYAKLISTSGNFKIADLFDKYKNRSRKK